jgi:nitrile hydratase
VNGVHDMGGMHGFGPIPREFNELVFHTEWERRAFAIVTAMNATGEWNLDLLRAARESLPPHEYLSKSYYEIWLAGMERLMLERGLVAEAEVDAGHSLERPRPVKRVLSPADVNAGRARRGSSERPATVPARFKVGDRVRARNMHPPTHTRLPRYVRGHVGTITIVHCFEVFPDSVVARKSEDPQWLYTVRFSGRELWGPDSDPTVTVSVDAWEPYLEAV